MNDSDNRLGRPTIYQKIRHVTGIRYDCDMIDTIDVILKLRRLGRKYFSLENSTISFWSKRRSNDLRSVRDCELRYVTC